MRFAAIAAVLLCLGAQGADKKKPPDLQILQFKAQREGSLVTIDGRLRAAAQKPITRLELAFDFRSAEHAALATKKADLDEDVLKAGDEAPFHFETECPAQAAEVRISAFKNGNAELNVENPGPYPIPE